MHPLYEESLQLSEQLKQARLEVAEIAAELSQAEDELMVIKAKIERGLIKKLGGERQLGPTVEDRERIFVVARDADSEYRQKREKIYEIKLRYEKAKIEVSALRERITIMLIEMRNEKGSEKWV